MISTDQLAAFLVKRIIAQAGGDAVIPADNETILLEQDTYLNVVTLADEIIKQIAATSDAIAEH